MIGELTRDGGMLALVFGLLDALVKTGSGEEHLVRWWWYPMLVSISIMLVGVGIWFERTREKEP